MDRSEELFNQLREGGEAAIDSLLEQRIPEELFLDFKRSADDGRGSSLHNHDRNNLSKAISGFGNSEGGVLVWGVDCSKSRNGTDLPSEKRPITNPARFVGLLSGVVSGCTVPPHSRVQTAPIPCASLDNEGFAVSLIPKSDVAPHQTVPDKRYFMRAGSSFEPVPHGVLAGMFGRRPQPAVIPQYPVEPAKFSGSILHLRFALLLRNIGRGIARDLFANLKVWSTPGPNCELQINRADEASWTLAAEFGAFFTAISVPSFRLPPESQVTPVFFRLDLRPPFVKDLRIEGNVGCGEAPSMSIRLGASRDTIESEYDFLKSLADEGKLEGSDVRLYGASIIGTG